MINDVKQVEQIIVISDTLQGWHVGWKAGVNGHQAAYSNWSQGGVNNTISATVSSVFYARFRDGRYAYGFFTNLRYGYGGEEPKLISCFLVPAYLVAVYIAVYIGYQRTFNHNYSSRAVLPHAKNYSNKP